MATITKTCIRQLDRTATRHLVRGSDLLAFVLSVRNTFPDDILAGLKANATEELDRARFYRLRANDARELYFDKEWKRQPTPDEAMFA